jgi:ParB family chromosome partitioning protein
MALSLKKVRPDDCDDSSQPRSNPDSDYCRRLGENMNAVGQKVPIIGYTDPATSVFKVIDGGCRLKGARQVGLTELLALDLGKEPTPTELLMAQAAIDIHKQHLPAMDRARLWQANMKVRACTARQLAKELGVSDSLVGDYLSLLKLPPDVQELVHSGALHMSKASLIAQMEDGHEQQRELAALAKDLSRSQLIATAKRRKAQAPAVKSSRVKVAMPHGASVVLCGKDLGMAEVVDLLTEALKEARKAAELFDVKTFVSMMRDKCKAGGQP